MALSVSAFPEPSRHPNELFTNGDEGHSKNVANTPRLLGLFGSAGSGASNKKPEAHVPTRAGKVEPESEGSHHARGSPPVTPVSSFPAFEILPQQEYEKELKLEEVKNVDPPRSRNQVARRAQLPPLPRRTTPSPVRLGPSNMTRLEIGAGTRNLPPAHVHSKSNPAPVVVVQDWSPEESPSSGSTSAALAHSSRPLPSVPAVGTDSFKTGSAPVSAVVSSPWQGDPIAGPSTHANAVAGPSKQLQPIPSSTNNANSIAGPSKQARSVSTSTSSSSVTPPSSKVLITQAPRGHKQNSSSLSMRYQPLIVDPSPSSSPLDGSASSSAASDTISNVGTTVLAAPNPIRPLPRIPPSSSILRPPASANTNVSSILSSRYTPPPAPVKRPRTSPSSISGFTSFSAGIPGPSSSSSTSPRSAFENIPSSWASKPVDLNSSRPSSPPLGAAGLLRTTTAQHHRPAPLKMPRARSYSRSRRERSLDSCTRLSGASRTSSASTSSTADGGMTRSWTVGKINTLTVTGARPLTKKVTVVPTINKQIAGNGSARPAKEGVGSSAVSVRKQTTLPTPPSPGLPSPSRRTGTQMTTSGPVSRTTKLDRSPNLMATSLPTRFYSPSSSKTSPKTSSPIFVVEKTTSPHPASQTADIPMHIPLEKKKVLTPLTIPVDSAAKGADTTAEQGRGGSAESTLEFFVDGPETDVPRINRSPSPIRYARPPSDIAPGNWQAHVSTEGETTDDDLAGASSSASNSPNLVPFKRKRVQLRSYRMDYRPQTQNVTDLPDVSVNDSNSRENLVSISTSAAATRMGTVVPSPSRSARRALPNPPKSKERNKGKEERKKKDKWSFSDFPSIVASGSGSASAPGTRNSSPERKGRSRQPRRLAEAVSLALGTSSWTTAAGFTYASGRGATAGPVSQSRFTASSSGMSPPWPHDFAHTQMIGDAEIDDVLDIRLPTFANSNMVFDLRKGGGPLPFEFNPDRMVGKSSGHSSASPKVMVTKGRRDETADTSSNYASESSLSGLDVGLRQVRGSGRAIRTASLEGRIVSGKVVESDDDQDEDAGEMPFMWLSRDKPPLQSMPIVLPPPQRVQHRRVGSSGAVARNPEASGSNPSSTRNRSFTQQISPPVPTPSTHSTMFRSSSVSSIPIPLIPFGKNLNQTENADHEVGLPTNSGRVSAEGRSVSDTSEGKQKERSLQERSEMVVTKSRRVVEYGEYWEDNRRTQVADVIPTLRTLKAEK